MTEAARRYLSHVLNAYIEDGYPRIHDWTFSPETEEEQRIHLELRRLSYIKQLVPNRDIFTDAGLRILLQYVPMSDAARQLRETLQGQVAALPARERVQNSRFKPRTLEDRPRYDELVARGFMSRFTQEAYELL